MGVDATNLLGRIETGLHQGFCLEWQESDVPHLWPGQALWAKARRMASHFRRLRLPSRARIAVQIPNSPLYVATLLASWMGNWVFCPLPSLDPLESQRRLALLRPSLFLCWTGEQLQQRVFAENFSVAEDDPDDLALVLWTSASSGSSRAFGLGFGALTWQVDTHLPALDLDADSLLRNTLPWAHVFAGVLELLPALLAGASLRVAPLTSFAREQFSHCCTVPRVAALLGPGQIQNLRAGIIGGAPMDTALAERMRGSRLRMGYGQSEAGPGLCLGDPGDFRAGLLGRGLVPMVQKQGTLHYRSPGQSFGQWLGDHWQSLCSSGESFDSGDLVQQGPDGNWFWIGRRDARFKLGNGRTLDPEWEELQLLASHGAFSHLVLAGPGARLPVVFGRLQEDARSGDAKIWQGTYPLRLAPESFWQRYLQEGSGKLKRALLYRHWQKEWEVLQG